MIIGFSGKKRSGKTEAANYLSKKLDIPVFSFATSLKKLVGEMTGLNDGCKDSCELYTGKVIDLKPLKKELFKFKYDQLTINEIDHIKALEYYKIGELYRNVLQYIGTNIFRTRHPQHWCNVFMYEHKKDKDFIVDDVRFANEYHLLLNYKDSAVYKLMRDISEDSDDHLSETELDTIRFPRNKIIKNNSDILGDFYKQLDELVK